MHTLTQVLNLDNNHIGDDGMRSLADAFAKGALPLLQKLLLSRNQIGNDGMIKLSEAVAMGAMANTKVSSSSLKLSHSHSA